MKIRVVLMTENNIDINDAIKLYGISKEECLVQAKAAWNIFAAHLSKDNDKIACESVELVEE